MFGRKLYKQTEVRKIFESSVSPGSMEELIQINDARLLGFVRDLGSIGRDPDRGAGLFRMALSDEDMLGRRWLIERAEAFGLETTVDPALNIRIRLPASDPAATTVMVGSHIDTVPNGGHLDGALGVLVGLESLARMQELIPQTERMYALELVAFTDEEGRFGGMLGSTALSGVLKAEALNKMRSPDGESVASALAARGADVERVLDAAVRPESLRAYLELHIEQGPVLVECGEQLGVVTGIVALWKGQLRFDGQANHAGTTPFRYRRDAFLGCARLRCEIEALVAVHGDRDTVATIGSVEVQPNSANIVPGACIFTVEIRDLDPAVVHRVRDVLLARAEDIAAELKLEYGYRQMSDLQPARCDQGLVDLFLAESAGFIHRTMPSAAAHDAQNMEKITPMAMLFVPSIAGISHDPKEETDDADIVTGATVFFRVLRRLVLGEASPTGKKYTEAAINVGATGASTIAPFVPANRSVLLCIDLQRMGPLPKSDFSDAELLAFDEAVSGRVIPNVRSLQNYFRQEQNNEVVHVRICSMAADGRDRSRGHRALDIQSIPMSEATRFLHGVGPVGDELVFNKTCSNVFVGTNLHYVLQNLGVRNLTVCGVFTDECVAGAVKSAADLGYSVTVPHDACAAGREGAHEAGIANLRRYADDVCSTAELLLKLQ